MFVTVNYLSFQFRPIPGEIFVNETLIRHGYLGCAPLTPNLAISIWTLTFYRQCHRTCPWFSIDAYCKTLCHMQKVILDIVCRLSTKLTLSTARFLFIQIYQFSFQSPTTCISKSADMLTRRLIACLALTPQNPAYLNHVQHVSTSSMMSLISSFPV